jgi:transposase-like protein
MGEAIPVTSYKCPKCGANLSVPNKSWTQYRIDPSKIYCPICGTEMTVVGP